MVVARKRVFCVVVNSQETVAIRIWRCDRFEESGVWWMVVEVFSVLLRALHLIEVSVSGLLGSR